MCATSCLGAREDMIILKGTYVLTCKHPDPVSVHWWNIGKKDILRDDGKEFTVEWVCLCNACSQDVTAKKATIQSKITRDFVTKDDIIPAEGVA